MQSKSILPMAIVVLFILGGGCAPILQTTTPTPEPTPRIQAPAATTIVQPSPAVTATQPRALTPTVLLSPTLVPIVPPTPTQGVRSEMSGTPTPTPSNLEAEQIVLQAKQDLAKQLTISVDQISLVEAQEVTWPDSSLGCPQLGMMYTQVLVDGYLIRLRVGDRIYEYHSGGNRPPFLCQNKP